ncbi:hypothetical protein MU852_05165 [Brevundimonas albigilva]|uniref:Uncharacterized protein n=1 Tax=Brevundimonas albigilva TaxID=1312364 RepID=A0ABY4SWM4_9CAUL|nr:MULTISPECIES: hypothetical protein [Brevundimonas]UQV19934.1 hypothetical protein MU852_05165 [Brevundimonas albigilva]URI17095.1 hypothetical protein M8231_02540 [Brevundimonas albigilva]
MAKRNAPTSSGGIVSVASLPAALLTPQVTMIARMAAISSAVRGCGLEAAGADGAGAVMIALWHAAAPPSAHIG